MAKDPVALRSTARQLASRMLSCSENLIPLCVELHRILCQLGLDTKQEDLAVLAAIESEADVWPIGVDPELVEPRYLSRCRKEMAVYGNECRPAIERACRAVMRLCSEP